MAKANAAVDFMKLLPELKGGKAMIEINKAASELMSAIMDIKKKGKLTLEIFIEPAGIGDDGRVAETSITWVVKVTKPEADRGNSVFWVTKEGGLSRTDPAQQEMFEAEDVRVDERR